MKTCFVISPIGQDGSEIRQAADDLFDLIIEPALEKFDFNVVRGDKIFNTNAITEDIINLVQNSELCIIDLSHQNPNVFYETGRRHETAKPFIHIKRKGEQIPFDIAGIRTIDYDLSDPRKTRESIDTLRKFINELEQIGYSSKSSGASLNSIATTLTRIERKLDSIGTSSPAASVDGKQNGAPQNPVTAFYSAYNSGNYSLAVSALKRFMNINHDVNLHLDMASTIVEVYEPSSVPIVKDILDKNFEQLTSSVLSVALFALYQFYSAALTIKDEYDYLKDTTNKALKRDLSDKDKAAFYNILANIEYDAKNNMKALEYQKKAIELAPEEGAYYYNIARMYKTMDMKDELLGILNMLLTLNKSRLGDKQTINTNYLQYARDIYAKYGLTDKINEIDELIIEGSKQTAGK
jgi:tetratricopeptide (TPR) repeat protein